MNTSFTFNNCLSCESVDRVVKALTVGTQNMLRSMPLQHNTIIKECIHFVNQNTHLSEIYFHSFQMKQICNSFFSIIPNNCIKLSVLLSLFTSVIIRAVMF